MKQAAIKPLYRLEDLLALSFQPEELHRSLSRTFPLLVAELPPIQESRAQYAHEVVSLLERHGSIDAPLFAHLLSSRPLRRAQIMSAACALAVDSAAIESLMADGVSTQVFRSPMMIEPKLVDALEDLVLEREQASADDPRREALAEDIERLAAQIRTRRPYRGGERVAGTILEYLIGRGTFGAVWRSRDAETGAPRATKIFDVNRLTDGVMLWRFRRGIRALETLNKYHGAPTSIARVHTVAEDGLAFSMEYFPRGSLENIAQRSWTLDKRIAVFNDVCHAVAFAHHAGVIHRDIKPTNVMLDAGQQPVLIDFDIADVQFLTEHQVTVGGIGTPMFAAPEQLACAGEVDERADIYSLGRLLHYMLIERVPTHAEQAAPLENLEHRLPSLSYTVRKATQARPCDRFITVGQLRREVETYKTGLAALRANLRRSMRWIRRNAVVVALASSGIVGTMIYAKQQEELAATHLQYQREAEQSFAQLDELTKSLERIQAGLEEARRVHEILKGQLADAKEKLDGLEQIEWSIEPRKFASAQKELSEQIVKLQVDIEAAEQDLEVLHKAMGDTVARISWVPRPRSSQAPVHAENVVAEHLNRARPVPAHPSSPSKEEGNPLATKQVVRANSASKARRVPVDLLERDREVRARMVRLTPAVWRCREKGTSPDWILVFALQVNAQGSVVKVRKSSGQCSEQTLRCIERLIRRNGFKPQKLSSPDSRHSIDFEFS